MDEYAKMAWAYDPATAWALDPLREELALAARACGAGRVLDLCCGTGRQALFFRQVGLRAVGLDLSPAMLDRAGRLPGLDLVRGDAARLPFPDASFCLTSVTLALHEKPESLRPVILAEMFRVTRTGGLVAVVDYLAPKSLAGRLLSLGVKAVERMAGREHHAFYAHYMKQGGLEGLLAGDGREGYELRRRFGGVFGIALLRREQAT